LEFKGRDKLAHTAERYKPTRVHVSGQAAQLLLTDQPRVDDTCE
jgi:hypothetical protein